MLSFVKIQNNYWNEANVNRMFYRLLNDFTKWEWKRWKMKKRKCWSCSISINALTKNVLCDSDFRTYDYKRFVGAVQTTNSTELNSMYYGLVSYAVAHTRQFFPNVIENISKNIYFLNSHQGTLNLIWNEEKWKSNKLIVYTKWLTV